MKGDIPHFQLHAFFVELRQKMLFQDTINKKNLFIYLNWQGIASDATKIIRPVLEFLFISNQFPTDLFSQMLNLSAAVEENLSELTSSNVWSYNTSTYNLLFNIKYGGGGMVAVK